jgi:Holliday junction resolvasome RuvABC DNA-binding subunit
MKMLQRQQKEKEKEANLSKKEQAILKLLDLNIDAKKAQKAVEQVLDSEEELEVSEIVIKAVQMISTNDKPKRK